MSKCYYHSEKEAVGQCVSCGKFLCIDCFNLTVGHYCYDCAQQLNAQHKKNMYEELCYTGGCIIFWVIGLILVAVNKEATGFLLYLPYIFFFIGGFYPAWKLTSKFNLGLFLKIILSLLLTCFMLPISIILSIRNLINYNKSKKQFNDVEMNHQQNLSK